MVGLDTWLEIGIGVGGIILIQFAGWLFLRCFRIYVPPSVAWALAFVMGVGVCGVLYTFVAMAGLLIQWVAVVLFVVLLIALTRSARRTGHQADVGLATEAWKVYDADRRAAVQRESQTWLEPVGGVEKCLSGLMWLLIGLITALTFYHALFFPETYWDSHGQKILRLPFSIPGM